MNRYDLNTEHPESEAMDIDDTGEWVRYSEILISDALQEKIAYAMQESYSKNRNRENACIEVMDKYPNVPFIYFRSMWDAIDAYVDINLQKINTR